MNERQRQQVALIVAHELELAERGAKRENNAVFAANSAKGILGSGATVKAVSSAIGAGSNDLLNTLLDKVGAVSRTPESHAQISAALEQHFANVEPEVVRSATMATRRGPGDPHSGILQVAMNLFDQIKSDMRAKIEIERFAFEATATEVGEADASIADPPSPRVNKGGKPLAAHWDGMWASIAVQLWTGDLQPKSQADIKRAMLNWFNAKEIDVGDTAVTERARQLWQNVEASQ